MRYLKVTLLSIGAIIAYVCIAALTDMEAVDKDISRTAFVAALLFIWCVALCPNRKFFS